MTFYVDIWIFVLILWSLSKPPIFFIYNINMANILELISQHIAAWKMVWFGLIFWGSICHAIVQRYELFQNIDYVSYLCFLFGLVIGLIAKMRGKWI